VRLTVRSTSPTSPLSGVVTFYLHDSFSQPIQQVQVNGGQAELTVSSWGAFTVGAVANGEQTMELDLSTLPEAPADWKAR
jgi:hypothetical protein